MIDQDICTDCGQLHKNCTCAVPVETLKLHDLFKIKDALAILDPYGMVDADLKASVENEINERKSKGEVYGKS